jgi:hypothetical protein
MSRPYCKPVVYFTKVIDKKTLTKYYTEDRLSMSDIALKLDCSVNKVVYWMNVHKMERRSISDAIYIKHNPNGDPFTLKPIKTKSDAELLGMGLGLYWGEGTKSNKHCVRLGNTDPSLLKTFILFLTELFGVKKSDMRFGLQIFTDINPSEAMEYWTRELGVEASQFYKIVVTISGSIGTYRKKSQYGVVTVYYHNKKLRDIVVNMLPR